ncbi:hypothetical protein F5I97DRAFT_884667 [Phlebopus sp. FC_14]|nr:hypothetical protein F5I97DRAFT_884667 [Phlebopus sp. FC_14]
MASASSPPTSGTEERFDKAKKHLWASDPPMHEENQLASFVPERGPSREAVSLDCINSRSGCSGTTDRPRSPERKARPEVPECILKASSTRRTQHVFPLPSREGFNFDQDRRLPPPRPWTTMDHSALQGRPVARCRTASTSLAKPSTNNESRQQPSSYPVSLSVFNSPTATYMWPGFQAASQMNYPPVIYVNYDSRDSTRSASTSSVSSIHDSPIISSPAITNYDLSAVNTLPQKRRSSSPDRRASAIRTSSGVIVGPMSQVQFPGRGYHLDSVRRPQPHGESLGIPRGGPLAPAVKRTPSMNNSLSFSDDDQGPAREDSPQASETSERSSMARPTIRRPLPRTDADAWECYAKPTLSPDGATRRWQCTWSASESGRNIDCKYTSKKQLVKRHVETTHLRYKPFVCTVCNKGFPQKTSLDTHMHGHTGSTPHVCRYGCGMAFKDPARRHRHMVEEHGYVPKQSKKKHKSDQPPQTTDFEAHRWNLNSA